MTVFNSLLAIALCALIAPLIAHLIPRNIVPEAVVLIGLGIVIGPDVLHLAHADSEILMLSELGLAFLFLLAGYEVDLDDLKSGHGMRASLAWLTSFVLAFALLQWRGNVEIHSKEAIAVAIAMTSTALGTLLPILKERGIDNTAVGRIVMTHGTVGEMFPIIAIALLLSY
ncbi:MAG: cation:proton antiporter, partial [Bowdeniella nasicola]|nr:cation:proton antiporter [Bowdeniella nasicola]